MNQTVTAKASSFSLFDGRVSGRIDSRNWKVASIIGLGTLLVLLLSIGTGAVGPGNVLQYLGGESSPGHAYVIEQVRLPRALVAILVGASLGLAGSILQSVSQNPLGSPDIVGFTAGASAAAVTGIIIFGAGGGEVALSAAVGGAVTAILVYGLSRRNGGTHNYRLILIGIAVSAMLASLTAFLVSRAGLDTAIAARVWLLGSLNAKGWDQVLQLTVALTALLPLTLILSRALRTMEMGDETATALGIPVERTRFALIMLSVGLTGIAVASAGPIAFVALAAPQLARRLTRATGPNLFNSMLMGALLLSASDLLVQRVFAPTPLPVGAMTGSLGGLYLIWLLHSEWRGRKAGTS